MIIFDDAMKVDEVEKLNTHFNDMYILPIYLNPQRMKNGLWGSPDVDIESSNSNIYYPQSQLASDIHFILNQHNRYILYKIYLLDPFMCIAI